MKRNTSKTVKSEAENKSWFGKLVGKFYQKDQMVQPSPKRVYHQTSEKQILKMFDLRKNNPNLTLQDIADIVKVHVQVVRYWLSEPEAKVRADFKAKRSKKSKTKKSKKKKVVREAPQTPTDVAPETTVEEELSLSNFVTLSNHEGEKILEKIKKTEKHPIRKLASPEWEGALPKQIVASKEEWKKEEKNYNIGKATMYKEIVKKQDAEVQSKKEEKIKAKRRIEHQKGLKDGTLRIHTDDCPSCNPNSKLTLKEYAKVTFLVFKEMKKFAIENDKVKKQLEKREKQLDEIEKETLGEVAQRVKEGTKICEECESRLSYSQATRSSAKFDGHYYCADHEPKS